MKKLRALREKSRRLNKKVANLENILTELKSRSLFSEEDCDLIGSLECGNKDFLKKVISPGPANSKYSPALRKFALCLHYISPKAYNFVRNSFNSCLPHPSTLRSWYKSFDGSPGFTDESLECIKLLVKRAKGKTIYCALSLDEMAIRKHVQWDGKQCVGLVNFGEVLDGDNVAVAREALVFMVTAVNDSWKIPVGYFLVDGCTGAQKANLVKQCVELLISCGVNIISLTFDGCPANFSMAKCLDCLLDPLDLSNLKTSFTIQNQEISIFPDPAHMLKLVRNTLGEKKELTNLNGQKISWQFIVNLHNLQNNEGLHLANRLRSQHINFAKQIMKVKLAAQTFSYSVAESIELCRKDLEIADFVDSEATVEFIKKNNSIFDILNSRNFHTFGFKKPMNDKNYSDIENFLNEMENYIVGLKLKDQPILQTNRKVGFFGFYICIQSLKKVYRNLIASKILNFVPLYKMSQDHLECFFSSIRAKGGFNNNPTAIQFKGAYKRLVIHGEIKHITSGNCIPLEDIKILTFSEMRYENKINLFTHTTESIDNYESVESLPAVDGDHDYLADPSRLSLYTQEVIVYIAGFVVKKLRKVIKCEECLLSLISNKYDGFIAKKDKGGLIYPSRSVTKICERAEKIFRLRSHEGIKFYNEKNLMQKLILSCFKDCICDIYMFENLHNNDDQILIGNHRIMLLKAVAMNYFEVRIHHSTKQFFAPRDRIRNIHNKLVLFKGQ